MNAFLIKKSTGEFEEFSKEKLKYSLIISGATADQANAILKQISPYIAKGISTKKIYRLAFRQLKKVDKKLASNYSLTKSIHELGPEGFHFEKFICEIFRAKGYEAKTNVRLDGKCVSHEIDVMASKPKYNVGCECKFHNRVGIKNDLKTTLYVKARYDDLMANPQNNLKEFWLISNTKFSKDAIQYANCAGLRLLGPNYPRSHALADLALKYKIFPITCISSLKKSEAKLLLNNGIILTKDLINKKNLLKKFGIEKIEEVIDEILNLGGSS